MSNNHVLVSYYYVEFIDKKVKSYGFTNGVTHEEAIAAAIKRTSGMIKEISKGEYTVLDACSGNYDFGIKALQKIKKFVESYEKERDEENEKEDEESES